MTTNSKLLKENKEKWGDKVRFVAVSLEGEDDTKELLTKKPEWV
jgi:cytochrome oxidase Cu insertion factor (SCO1/SenC/PrrC family)